MNRGIRWIALGAFAAVLAVGATGCSDDATATTASCAFVVGDGQEGHDAQLHHIVYPGQQVDLDEDGAGVTETVSYVPCNSRNYITNDGTTKNANGDKVGDRFTPTVAYTSTGVQIKIWTTAYWTPNQGSSALRNFYTLCFKYDCASNADQGGDLNFSTKGWNGLLGENFGPAIDEVAGVAAYKAGDTIWQKHDPAEYKKLSDEMTAGFADAVRVKTGYSEDLFCGSGNSGWKDPKKPGAKGNEFECSKVRIVVDKVERGQVDASDGTDGAAALNAQRLKNARAIYGANAEYWLGMQDTVEKCKATKVTCVFTIGGGNAPSVPGPTK